MKTYNFASIQGGTGQSTLIYNFGAYLASIGKQALMIDLDFFGSGISGHPSIGDELFPEGLSGGFSDLMHSFYENDAIKVNGFISPNLLLKKVQYFQENAHQTEGGNLYAIDSGKKTVEMQMFPRQRRLLIENSKQKNSAGPPFFFPDSGNNLAGKMTRLGKAIRNKLESFQGFDGERKPLDYVLIDCRLTYADITEMVMKGMADEHVFSLGIDEQGFRSMKNILGAMPSGMVEKSTFILNQFPEIHDELIENRLTRFKSILSAKFGDSATSSSRSFPWKIYMETGLRYSENPWVLEKSKSDYSKSVITIANKIFELKNEIRWEELIEKNSLESAALFSGGNNDESGSISANIGNETIGVQEIGAHDYSGYATTANRLENLNEYESEADENKPLRLREGGNVSEESQKPVTQFYRHEKHGDFYPNEKQEKEETRSHPSAFNARPPYESNGRTNEPVGGKTDEIHGRSEHAAPDPGNANPNRSAFANLKWHWPLKDGTDVLKVQSRLFPGNRSGAISADEFLTMLAVSRTMSQSRKEEALNSIRANGIEAEGKLFKILEKEYRSSLAEGYPPNDSDELLILGKTLQGWLFFMIDSRSALQQTLCEISRGGYFGSAANGNEPPSLNNFWMNLAASAGNERKNFNSLRELLDQAYRSSAEDRFRELSHFLMDMLGNYSCDAKSFEEAIEGILSHDANFPFKNLINLIESSLNFNNFENVDFLVKTLEENKSEIEPEYHFILAEILLFDVEDHLEFTEQLLRSSIENSNNTEWEMYYLGLVHCKNKNLHKAERYLKLSIQKKPDFFAPMNSLGNLFCEEFERYEEAEKAYRDALKIKPGFPIPWFGLAKIYHYSYRKHSEAASYYLKAVSLKPDFEDAWFELAILYSHCLSNDDEAEKAFQKAIRLNPESDEYWEELGQLYLKKPETMPKAEEAFKKSLEINPGNQRCERALKELGSFKAGAVSAREEFFLATTNSEPKNPLGWLYLGDFRKNHTLDFAGAGKSYAQALGLWDNSAKGLSENAELETFHFGNIAKGEESLFAAAKKNSSSAQILWSYAKLKLFAFADVEGARNRISQLVPLNQNAAVNRSALFLWSITESILGRKNSPSLALLNHGGAVNEHASPETFLLESLAQLYLKNTLNVSEILVARANNHFLAPSWSDLFVLFLLKTLTGENARRQRENLVPALRSHYHAFLSLFSLFVLAKPHPERIEHFRSIGQSILDHMGLNEAFEDEPLNLELFESLSQFARGKNNGLGDEAVIKTLNLDPFKFQDTLEVPKGFKL